MITDLLRTTKIMLSNKRGISEVLKVFVILVIAIIALFIFVMCNTLAPPAPMKKP